MGTGYNHWYMYQYKEVSKEEYELFITDYEKQHKLKGHYYNDWYEIYDFEVSKFAITRSSPDDKYYILKEVLSNEV